MQSLNREIARTKTFVNILRSERFSDLADERFEVVLNRKVSNWETSTRSYLENTHPFKEHLCELRSAELDFKTHGSCEASILTDLENLKSLNKSANVSFWERKTLAAKNEVAMQENRTLKEILNAIRRNEQEAWRKEYEEQLLDWQLMEIRKLRTQFLKYLEEWFETMQQMKEVFDDLDIEPGLLWDLGADELTEQDISFLKEWAEYLNKAKAVRDLCELMGRLRKAERSDNTEIVHSTVRYCIRKPDLSSNEMMVGIELGRDLENVIPQELALLSDADVALLFDLKYVEKRLMCFSKQGYKEEIVEEVISKTVTVTDDEKMGPIIICLDTSDSMTGASEYVAKALTLSIVSRAASQKRKCYLINFSTSIETLDLTPPKGIRDLLNFLKMSFHGGTDVVPALYEGVRMMQNENYEKADLLVMSDFLFPRLSPDIVSLCKQQKQNDNRFFALAVTSFDNDQVDEEVFDQSWNYNTRRDTLSEIRHNCRYSVAENLIPTSFSR
ncbi:VWA domain-containing protein [Methanolobus sp. WCC5]|uniref:VWA domain-containing protein n=1 Tax=Methanolobus sp. WCC5 TaxID=3125785 RepID=UPI003254F366